MCNLYSSTTATEAMRQLFAIRPDHDHLGNHEPLTAIYPRYDAPVVRLDAEGEREAVMMHWGFLLPQTGKRGQPIMPKAVNNARDDKIRTSPFWRASFEQRRCLVPASSFCEAKGRNPATYVWFGMTSDDPAARPPFAFAGLWGHWRGRYRDGLAEIDTHTIITTSPNALVRPVHPDRMPVILDPANYEQWLTGTPDEAVELLEPCPAEKMQIVKEGSEREDG
ncbi:SOS response-associated peptidase [Defluviimonas sp. WL0002]|uniref:Abasic site processing protein n=1 Tax=Albidovulum marisflavi TaxID=2984159 RepID=A0ABT2ZGY0_9RHOB|nr:SOS response-associated peptidase [Defluviimonas sp. WL0002]MCV2870380.1 SOS response-associated peptidase [Defluviimonas sp. WL0002]